MPQAKEGTPWQRDPMRRSGPKGGQGAIVGGGKGGRVGYHGKVLAPECALCPRLRGEGGVAQQRLGAARSLLLI